ncbi:hypothetical protein WN55_03382 [Dufourea novaeangliae]|uniref:Uncharacterized protein n=1 Tax=Dufourea novaeangliae TaxID=178035 RepID=A0A154PJ46_DUFNO|nr:hypothetical protein WN55_03382 [Dufourea novaeangliae]
MEAREKAERNVGEFSMEMELESTHANSDGSPKIPTGASDQPETHSLSPPEFRVRQFWKIGGAIREVHVKIKALSSTFMERSNADSVYAVPALLISSQGVRNVRTKPRDLLGNSSYSTQRNGTFRRRVEGMNSEQRANSKFRLKLWKIGDQELNRVDRWKITRGKEEQEERRSMVRWWGVVVVSVTLSSQSFPEELQEPTQRKIQEDIQKKIQQDTQEDPQGNRALPKPPTDLAKDSIPRQKALTNPGGSPKSEGSKTAKMAGKYDCEQLGTPPPSLDLDQD